MPILHQRIHELLGRSAVSGMPRWTRGHAGRHGVGQGSRAPTGPAAHVLLSPVNSGHPETFMVGVSAQVSGHRLAR